MTLHDLSEDELRGVLQAGPDIDVGYVDVAAAMRSGRRRRRTRAALAGSAAAVVVTSVVLFAVDLSSGQTASTTPARQSQRPTPGSTTPPTPTGTATPQTSETPGSEPTGELSPGAGRAAAAHHHVPADAVTDLRAAVHDLTVTRPAYVGPVSARLLAYRLDSWRSPSDFTVLVTIDLHFATRDTMAWNEGSNTRFVRFTSTPGSNGYRLTWATSPF